MRGPALPQTVLFKFGRLCARFDRWTPAVVSMAGIRGLSRIDLYDRLRFSYACLMARASVRARNAFAGLLRRELGLSAPGDLWLGYTAWCFGSFALSRRIFARAALRWPGSDEARIALHQAEFARKAITGQLPLVALSAIAAAQLPPAPQRLILVPVSSRYGQLFELWAEQVRLHLPGQIVVLAMDDTVAHIARAGGFRAISLASSFAFTPDGRIDVYSKRHLWLMRVLVLQELLRLGHTVVSLDLDAIPVGPVQPMLDALPPCDLVAQRDFSIPVDVARELGFILCCGFMVFFPTSATTALLQIYAARVLLELDDQTALNHLLVESGIRPRLTTPTCMSFESAGAHIVCPDTSLVSRTLESGSVIRHFQQRGESTETIRARLGLSPAVRESQFSPRGF